MKTFVIEILKSPEKSFILLAAIFGLLTIFLMPPFTGADEEAHFVRAYGITNGAVVLDRPDVMMPKAYRQTLGCLQSKSAVSGVTYSYTYENYGKQERQTRECIFSINQNLREEETVITTAGGYSPTTYIPQLAAIGVGRVLNAPIVIMSYMVRLSVLAAYIILIVIAIRLLPTRKWALVGIALLPHSLIQITNPGADYMLLGSIAVFTAAIFRSLWLSEFRFNKYNKKLFLIIIVASIFLVLPKGIFPGVCFLPLLFLYGGLKKQLTAKVIVFLGVLLVGILWQKATLSATIGSSGGGLSSVMSFPYAFIKTMFYDWANTDFIYRYLGLGFGNRVGMPSVMITIANMLLALYLFVEYSKEEAIRKKLVIERKLLPLASGIIAAAVIVGSFAAMHIAAAYLQDGSNLIKGVQARYFYPALLLLAVVPYRRLVTTAPAIYSRIVIAGSASLLFAQTIAIAIRFW